jgi:hypothetical protein
MIEYIVMCFFLEVFKKKVELHSEFCEFGLTIDGEYEVFVMGML